MTQIPLDSPRPDGDTPTAKARPPWIRPIRKKTTRSSASTESSSQHGSPEGFSPSYAFLDLSGAASVASPQPPAAAFSPSVGGAPFGMAGRPAAPSFMTDGLGGLSAESMTINPSELLAMFGSDSASIDVASLLMSPQQRSMSGAFFGALGESEGNAMAV